MTNYFIYLVELDQGIGCSFFISIGKPDFSNNGFIEVRGVYASAYGKLNRMEVTSNYKEILSANKDKYDSVMFPWHRVQSIKLLGKYELKCIGFAATSALDT